MAAKWIKGAVERMRKKGTLGSFGKATSKKIAAAKKKGGVRAKKAIFAQTMKRIAAKRASGGSICKTPGLKIRSKGRGRGLAVGGGRGPLGRR